MLLSVYSVCNPVCRVSVQKLKFCKVLHAINNIYTRFRTIVSLFLTSLVFRICDIVNRLQPALFVLGRGYPTDLQSCVIMQDMQPDGFATAERGAVMDEKRCTLLVTQVTMLSLVYRKILSCPVNFAWRRRIRAARLHNKQRL